MVEESITVTIGNGGAVNGGSGANSIFGTMTSIGGGGGSVAAGGNGII